MKYIHMYIITNENLGGNIYSFENIMIHKYLASTEHVTK